MKTEPVPGSKDPVVETNDWRNCQREAQIRHPLPTILGTKLG